MAGSKEIEREVLDGKGMSAEEFARLKRKREQMRIKSRQLENLTNFFDFETDDLMLVGEIEEEIKHKTKEAEQKEEKETYIRWIITYDPKHGARRILEVEVDEGANANFLTRGVADDRRLQVCQEEEAFRGETMNSDLVCHEHVDMTLFDEGQQSSTVTFWVVPNHDPPNDPRIIKPVVGRHFVHQFEHLLLKENPQNPVKPTKMGKEPDRLREERELRAAEVEAYQARTSQARNAPKQTQGGQGEKQQSGSSSSRKSNSK